MKTKIISALAATFAALALSVTANAIPMVGSVEYNLDASAFTFDDSSVNFLADPSGKVNNASGDFVGLIGMNVVHTNFINDPFGASINPLVVIGGFTFALDTMTSYDFSAIPALNIAFLNIVGRGIISQAGFDDTWATWTFAATEDALSNNYSATITTLPVPVPDGGSALAGLGFAIGVIVVISRKRSAISKPRLARRYTSINNS